MKAPKQIVEFLKNNGFKKTRRNALNGHSCEVSFHSNLTREWTEINTRNGSVFFDGHSIYSIIGYLTYSGLMDKNYYQ